MTERIAYQSHTITPREVFQLPDRRSSGAYRFLKGRVAIIPVGVNSTGCTSQGLRGYITIAIIRLAREKQNRVADAHLTMTRLSTWAGNSADLARAERLSVELDGLINVSDDQRCYRGVVLSAIRRYCFGHI